MSVFARKKFKVLRAIDDGTWRASIALQEKVYCKEKHYEKRPTHADPSLFDEHDVAQSHRIVMTCNSRPVATTRVVTPGQLSLPAFRIQPETENLDEDYYIESSSFCISKELRIRHGLNTPEASKFMTIGLIAGIAAIAKELNVPCVVMAIERSLFRYLTRLGLPLQKVGGPVEYHGARQVCTGWIFEDEGIIPSVRRKNPDVWHMLTGGAPLRELLETPAPALGSVA